MTNVFVLLFMGLLFLIFLTIACLIITRVLVILCEFFLALYKCLFPDGEPNSWHIGCCCCDIIVDCSGSCSNLPRYCITQTITLCNKINFHCCNQWGCMARHFGCRCCRKSIKKIVPIKKNYSNNHIIIINPYDNNYKIGTVSKTVNIV
mgnify:CR=1 FL=1|jgi:hypothetical protein